MAKLADSVNTNAKNLLKMARHGVRVRPWRFLFPVFAALFSDQRNDLENDSLGSQRTWRVHPKNLG